MATPHKSGYEAVDQIEDPDGIVAIISSRVSGNHPKFTIGIFKKFMRDDEEVKTSFFDIRQCDAVIRVLEKAKAAAEKHTADAHAKIEARQEHRKGGR